MLFRNVALISLALVAAASAADTSPTSNHVSSLLSQRRLPKEVDAAKANSKAKDNKKDEKKDDKKADNKNVVIPVDQLQINSFQGLNTLGYGSFSLNGSMGDGTNTSGTPTGQTLIEPNRESEDGAGDDEGMGGGVTAGEASSEGPATGEDGMADADADMADGDMADADADADAGVDNMGGDDTAEDEEDPVAGPTGGAGTTGGGAPPANAGESLTGCAASVQSILAKGESPINTDKRCKMDCDCVDGCCVMSGWGGFCTPKSDSDPMKSRFGGGYLYCMSAVRPSQ